MEKYTNQHKSRRLKTWDYTTSWWYFITICCNHHKNYFGEINETKIALSDVGKIVEEEWLNTELIREYVELDYYVIMPNHFHGIIIINEKNDFIPKREDISQNVPTTNKYFSEISPKQGSLSLVIRSFKSAVTRRCNNKKLQMKWQPNFYDRIIRDEAELYKIRKYIDQNPMKWELDSEISENFAM